MVLQLGLNQVSSLATPRSDIHTCRPVRSHSHVHGGCKNVSNSDITKPGGHALLRASFTEYELKSEI